MSKIFSSSSSDVVVNINKKKKILTVFNLTGLTPYATAWQFQKVLSEHIHQSRKSSSLKDKDKQYEDESVDYLILVEHPRIFTLGRGASEKNIKFNFNKKKEVEESAIRKNSVDYFEESNDDDGICLKEKNNDEVSVVRVERGGEVTWHGPGQLVAYPILDLNNFKRDLHWYTHALEETVIQTMSTFGIHGQRSEVNTGVWVGVNKLSAVGVAASRWITMHGSSLNVCCNMSDFSRIIPCGITVDGRGVCSMQQLRPELNIQNTDAIRLLYARSFAQTFGVDTLNILTKDESLVKLNTLLDIDYPNIKNLDVHKLF